MMKRIFKSDPTSFSIFINILLLLIAMCAYVFVDKYLTATANQKIENIEEKAEGELSEKDAIEIGKEMYYMAIATLTQSTTDFDKLYDQIKTTDLTLTDEDLIKNLNSIGAKTFATDSSVQVVENYEEAINNNFTDDFITNNIMYPNGFIGKINDSYYIVSDKKDNSLFKEVEMSLVSKDEKTMTFTAANVNHSASCVGAGGTMASITCTDTNKSEQRTFKLVKENDQWKIAEMEIKTS